MNLEQIPNEILFLLFQDYNIYEINKIIRINKFFCEIFGSDDFWKKLYLPKFMSFLENSMTNYKYKYEQNITKLKKLENSLKDLLKWLIKNQYIELLKNYAEIYNYSIYSNNYKIICLAVLTDNPDILELLFREKIDILQNRGSIISKKNNIIKASVIIACMYNKPKSLLFLIKYGANLNWLYIGLDPLNLACYYNYISIIQILLDNNQNINQKINFNNKQIFPLFIAVQHANLELIKFVINSGANLDFYNNYPLLFVACHGNLVLELSNISEGNRIDTVKYLLDIGEKNHINFETDLGRPLDISCRFHRYDIIKLLLEYSASLNFFKNNPFYISVQENNLELCKILVDYVPNNIINYDFYSWGRTILHIIIILEKIQIFDIIMNSYNFVDNLNFNIQDSYGKTALHYACSKNSLYLAENLVQNGSDIHIKDNLGISPYDLAKQNQELIEILKLYDSDYMN